MTTLRSSAPALRNRDPILNVLREAFAAHSPVRQVLEIATGTGEHLEHFAAAFPDCDFYASDVDQDALAPIAARLQKIPNVVGVSHLDVCGPWPDLDLDAVLVANMFHISPADTVPGFMQGASQKLRVGGIAHIYGPFQQNGQHTAASNAAFHESLLARDPAWGIRDLESVLSEAQTHGLRCEQVREMPANNLSILLRREDSQ